MNLPDQIKNVIQALTHIPHHLFIIVSEQLHDTYGSCL